jgi:hypothetical protein
MEARIDSEHYALEAVFSNRYGDKESNKKL